MPEITPAREAEIRVKLERAAKEHGSVDYVPPTFGLLRDALAELDRVRAELAKYVGVEPTVADEMAYLQRCLNAVYEVCDQTAAQSTRWENPLPIPEWVLTVRQAAAGDRADNPDDKRRRIYLDGAGIAWISQSKDPDSTEYIAPVDSFGAGDEPAADVRERTGALHEIGRCW